MTCYSCIEKLARKLIDNHRRELDFIRALELAEKGVERVANRPKRWWQRLPPFSKEVTIILGAFHGFFNKVVTCPSCMDKAFKKYKTHGLSDDEAWLMAKKLMARVEKRKRKEQIRAGYKNIGSLLWKWTFLCNWRATFWNRTWIGKSFNPDYTQACGGSGTPGCFDSAEECTVRLDCAFCDTASCTCPAPLPNSNLQAKLCTSLKTGGTTAGCNCNAAPDPDVCFDARVPNHTCQACANVCTYDCIVPYVWNGVACVLRGGWFDFFRWICNDCRPSDWLARIFSH